MKVGDLVKEKYVTGRLGIILAICNNRCRVIFMDGDIQWNNTYHFWEVKNESR